MTTSSINKTRSCLIFGLLLCIVGSITSRTAIAQQITSLAISPAVIEINLKPGQVRSNKIIVRNTSTIPLGVGIYLNKVTPEEAKGLTVDLKKPEWVKVSDSNLLLKAGESREVEVVTSPNRKTPPGGYYGIIYFQAAIPISEFNLGQTTAIPKLGAFLLINVEGKNQKKFEEVNKIDYPVLVANTLPETFFSVKNTGNVHIVPNGHIELNRLGKDKQYRQGFPPTVILPSTTRQVTIPEIKDIEQGIYKIVRVSLYEHSLGLERREVGYILVVGRLINLIGIFAGALVILCLLFLVRKRKHLAKAFKVLLNKDYQ